MHRYILTKLITITYYCVHRGSTARK